MKKELQKLIGANFKTISMSDFKLANRTVQARNRVWVLVEGYLDFYFYSKIFDEDEVHMRQALNQNDKGGKQAIINILQDPEVATYQNVIGIVDKDYEWLLHRNSTLPNLFETDYKDLEITLINEPIVRQNIAAEIPIFDVLYNTAIPVARYYGYLHITSDFYSKPWNMRVKDFKWSGICANGQIQAGYQNHMLQLLNRKLQSKGYNAISFIEYNNAVSTLQLDNQPDEQICHGHAMVKTLSLLNQNPNLYDEDHLSVLLADNCPLTVALSWDCCRRIDNWQHSDVRNFNIFKQ